MLIGFPNKKANSTPENCDIFDVNVENFEATVIKESLLRPIFIQFWAPWCAPCKQLMPIMESLVTKNNGQIALAKVNIDENPELAQAFRVQSVPMVIAMYQGQPVTGFAGVRPQSDIENIIKQLIAMHNQNQPQAIDIPLALKDASAFLAAGDILSAKDLYAAILEQNENEVEAYTGIIRALIAEGNMLDAEHMINSAPDVIKKDNRFPAVITAYQLALNVPNGDIAVLERALANNPKDCATLYNLSELYLADGRREDAINALFSIIQIDRKWEDDKARKQVLIYLEAWGFADPLSISTRRKLSTLLFS